ncbi:DNA-directed RNA polymerase subunit omega [bacterium AH-315-C07]|nr:DNA-directed RNA polymerase subunit omega [bacterium AH-315-C07]
MYQNVPDNTQTRNLIDFEKGTENTYESVVILSKRANMLGLELKEELHAKLAEFDTTIDNLEEIFENTEQIELSKYYERLPKPALIAIEEFLEEKIYFRKPTEEELEESKE